MSPFYDIATETIVLQANIRHGCYPFSLAWLPDVYNIIGWKTTAKGELAVFERNVDNTVSVEVRTCLRTPFDAHLSFAEFKARQAWRDAAEMGNDEYSWLLAHSDYASRCNAKVRDERPQPSKTSQLLTIEQECELYQDWIFPLADLDCRAQDEDTDESIVDSGEDVQSQQQCASGIRDGRKEVDTDEVTPETLDDDSEFDVDYEIDADPIDDMGDFTSIFCYAETMLNTEHAEPSEDMTMMDEDEDGSVDIETFDVELAHPSPTLEEKRKEQVTVITPEPPNPVRRSKRARKPARKATSSRMKTKAATSPYVLSSLKCPLCIFRPREGSGAKRSLDRHTKRHDANREVFVCLGVEGCERLFARRDAWVRHFDEKECPGECVKMRSSEYLQMFPGNEEKLKSHLERNHKF